MSDFDFTKSRNFRAVAPSNFRFSPDLAPVFRGFFLL